MNKVNAVFKRAHERAGAYGKPAQLAVWLCHLGVSFCVTVLVVGALACSGTVPWLLGIVDRRRAKRLHVTIHASRFTM
eukprot:359151-Chlamydomonas_euryale.AAC.7